MRDCPDDSAEQTVTTIVLSEIRAMREQIAALTSELRSRKHRAAKRVRSRRAWLGREPDPVYKPTELDIARARRALR